MTPRQLNRAECVEEFAFTWSLLSLPLLFCAASAGWGLFSMLIFGGLACLASNIWNDICPFRGKNIRIIPAPVACACFINSFALLFNPGLVPIPRRCRNHRGLFLPAFLEGIARKADD